MFHLLAHYPVTLIIMLLLMIASAFFSMSESAFFSLGHLDRRRLSEGGTLARSAFSLLSNPERLLTSILLGNLVVNFLFFTLSSVVVIQLQQEKQYAISGVFGIASLLSIIVFSEMLPKNFGVLAPRWIAILCTFPLTFLVNLLAPVLRFFGLVNRLSMRLLFPALQKEPYLRVDDLEQAVELSKGEASLLRREEKVLQHVLHLSRMSAEELMCPRTHLHFFPPPTTFEQVMEEYQDDLPKVGYILISEKESEELACAVSLRRIGLNTSALSYENKSEWPNYVWDETSDPVVYIPWTLSVADAFDVLRTQEKEVAAVLNEYGTTIGILTLDDIFDLVFGRHPSRSRRLLNRAPITKVGPEVWHVTGLTNLKRLQHTFDIEFPSQANVTIAGFLQERLERLPKPGDEITFGPLHFRVISTSENEVMVIEVKRNPMPVSS